MSTASCRAGVAVLLLISMAGLVAVWEDFPVTPSMNWTTARILNVSERREQSYGGGAVASVYFPSTALIIALEFTTESGVVRRTTKVANAQNDRYQEQLRSVTSGGLRIAYEPEQGGRVVAVGLFNPSNHKAHLLIAMISLLAAIFIAVAGCVPQPSKKG